jgi:aminoglycoside phosphotransferase
VEAPAEDDKCDSAGLASNQIRQRRPLKETPVDFYATRFFAKHRIDLPKVLEAKQYENHLYAQMVGGTPASMEELMKLSQLVGDASDSVDAISDLGRNLDHPLSPD